MTVSISMPVFNGERFIREALDSLCAQTYKDWKLLIADNASTDGTEVICKEYAAKDPRITYFRHSENLGAQANFDYLLSQADGEYCMWAASDDEWDPGYVEACVRALETKPKAGFAFGDLVHTDSRGKIIRRFPSFSRFAGPWRALNIYRALKEHVIMGKPNLLYALYRREFLQKAWPRLQEIWHSKLGTGGVDASCVFHLLLQQPLAIAHGVNFRKRWITPTDAEDENQYYEFKPSIKIDYPPEQYANYRRFMLQASRDTGWKKLVNFILTKRLKRIKKFHKNKVS